MALKWLRRHRKTVFAPLAVIVVVTMVFMWGSPNKEKQGSGGVPQLTIDGEVITSNRFQAVRTALVHITNRPVEDGDVVVTLLGGRVLDKLNVQVAPSRLNKQMRLLVALRTRQDSATIDDVRRYLSQRNLAAEDLVRVLRFMLGWGDLMRTLGNAAAVSDRELYIAYRRTHQRLSFAYSDFSVGDYMDQVEAPGDEVVRQEYERRIALSEHSPDALVVPSRYRFAYVLAPEEKYEEAVGVDEEKLKGYYDEHKDNYRDGGDEPKPLDEVKARVEEDFRHEKTHEAMDEALEKARVALERELNELKVDAGIAALAEEGALDQPEERRPPAEGEDAAAEEAQPAEEVTAPEGGTAPPEDAQPEADGAVEGGEQESAPAEGEEEAVEEGEAEGEGRPRVFPPEEKVLAVLKEAAKETLLEVGVIDWTERTKFAQVEPLGDASALELPLSRIRSGDDVFKIAGPTRIDKGRVAAVLLGVKEPEPRPFEGVKDTVVEDLKRVGARVKAEKEAKELADNIIVGTEELSELESRVTMAAREAPAELLSLPLGKVSTEPVLVEADTENEAYRVAVLIKRELPAFTEFENDSGFRRIRRFYFDRSRREYSPHFYFEHWENATDVQPAGREWSDIWYFLRNYDLYMRRAR